MKYGIVYVYFFKLFKLSIVFFKHLKNVVINILGHELICVPWCNSIKCIRLSVVITEIEIYY